MTVFHITYECPPIIVGQLTTYIEAATEEDARADFIQRAPSSTNRTIRPATEEEVATLEP